MIKKHSEATLTGRDILFKSLFIGAILSFYLIPGVSALTNISTCGELQNITLNLTEDYELINDINCIGFNFTKIGPGFGGSFNGNNYTIINLTVSCSLTNCGMFSSISSGTPINNFNMINPNVQSTNTSVGVVVGTAFGRPFFENITIINPYVVSPIERGSFFIGQTFNNPFIKNVKILDAINSAGGNDRFGGLIGYIFVNAQNDDLIIEDSVVDGFFAFASKNIGSFIGEIEITGGMNITIRNSIAGSNNDITCFFGGGDESAGAGGLIGSVKLNNVNTKVLIEESYAESERLRCFGTIQTGGLIGLYSRTTSLFGVIINNSYSNHSGGMEGSITAGLVANVSNGGLNIIDSYSSSNILSGTTIGGLVAVASGSNSVTDSFFDSNTSQSTADAICPECNRTTAEMQTASTFINAGWSFSIWNMTDGFYPFFGTTALPPINTTIGITVIQPQNITYDTTNISLIVSANKTVDTWTIILNGNATVLTPNTTFTALEGANTIFIQANDTDGSQDNDTVVFTVTIIPPAPPITALVTFCSTDDILFSIEKDVADNGSIVYNEVLRFCPSGCGNFTLWRFGQPGCFENDFQLAVMLIIFAIIAVLVVRGVFK